MKNNVSETNRNHVTLSVYWGMRVLLIIAAAAFLWRGDLAAAGSTVVIFFLMLLPSLLKKRYRFYLPFAIDLGITSFVFLTLFLGEVARFYDRIPLWDKFIHFQSGLILGATGFVLIYTLNEHERFKLGLNPGFISLFAITFSITIGVIWEFGEFALDAVTGTVWANGLSDTIWDLIADSVGALIVSVVGYFWMYRHKRLPFTPWLLNVFEQVKERVEREG